MRTIEGGHSIKLAFIITESVHKLSKILEETLRIVSAQINYWGHVPHFPRVSAPMTTSPRLFNYTNTCKSFCVVS